ncbi:hypothetical protein [Desulfomonile tiedjei]|uniref:Glutaredoxin n=1 Tax=Desulfomonile tiedjei (strain ATCC 49306 / DSM 6799 / DCB-1) TaxID=706587 RepID=I4C225_DESTA|nr:hypothetical protein [Desulfomonile tiedjei]AFM23616.1 hypothetical protein Desti_0897 [Desulfomonile tiedjei DSM 6799]
MTDAAHHEEELNDSPDAVLVEVICERYHCVMYDYAITTVEFVAEDFEKAVRVRPVVRRGNRENAERFFELCKRNGRHLSVPTILIDGKVVFTDVPGPEELRKAIEQALDARKSVADLG